MICSNKCKKSMNSVKLVSIAGCSDDLAAVAALPDQWVPKRSGTTLKNYLKKQKCQHEHLLFQLNEIATKVNSDTDKSIREISDSLLNYIKHNESEVKCLINKAKEIKMAEYINKEFTKLNESYSERLDEITKFKLSALSFERTRADKLRILLRKQFRLLIEVYYKPPREILHEFDIRIYEINEQLLNNLRAYLELEVQLRFQADSNIQRAKACLNHCLEIKLEVQPDLASKLHSIDKMFSLQEIKSIRLSEDKSDSKTYLINKDVQNIEDDIHKLIEIYRGTVANIFLGFSGKLSTLQKEFGIRIISENTSTKPPFKDLHEIIYETINRVTKCFWSDGMISTECYADIAQIQTNLITLSSQLHGAYSVLHDAGHLWDAHMMRASLAQQLIRTALEDFVTSNDAIELANEISVNIALEQLRTCSELDKVQQQYENVLSILDRNLSIFQQHNELEINKLEEYLNLTPAMANVLIAEFNCFLDRHQWSRLHTASNITQLSTPRSVGRSTSTPLARVLLQTELQGIALLKWVNGFIETLERNMLTIFDDLKLQARSWIDDRKKELKMRHFTKLHIYNLRTERVKTLKNFRLSELRYHDVRLNSHLRAVQSLIDKLLDEAAGFLSIDDSRLYPICKWLDLIQVNIKKLSTSECDFGVKYLKMSSYALRLTKYRNLFIDSLDIAIKEFKKEIEDKIHSARISNFCFLSKLKLFNEGSHYSYPEAIKTSANLVKISDTLEGCANKIMESLNVRKHQLMALADQKIVPVQRIVEEVVKASSKGIQDKRKLLSGRK